VLILARISSPLLDNNIGDNGAKHIADALMSNSSLKEVEPHPKCATLIRSPPIAPSSRASHSDRRCSFSPASLPLLANNIGDNGAKHIADALMSNSSLTKLDLSGAPPSFALLPSLRPPAHPTPIAGAHSRPHLFLLF
jgi:hypothetical protein